MFRKCDNLLRSFVFFLNSTISLLTEIARLCMKKLLIMFLNISYILSFLVVCRGVLSFRFGVYETIYNPVLSDYFGFDERTAAYFFFALVVSQITGTVLL